MLQIGMFYKVVHELCNFSHSDNETIRKEFENYRKDHCNFLLYGYCQRGELLLENLEEIHFDDGNQ